MVLVKWIMVCMLVAASGLAEQPPSPTRPVCNAASRGRFWPEAANSDPGTARKLSQCGTLDVCMYGTWKYKWRPLTVNVRQLGKTPQEPSPQCAALMSEVSAREKDAAPATSR